MSSGTDGGSVDPLGLEQASAVRKAPLVVSATSVMPNPGDLQRFWEWLKLRVIYSNYPQDLIILNNVQEKASVELEAFIKSWKNISVISFVYSLPRHEICESCPLCTGKAKSKQALYSKHNLYI